MEEGDLRPETSECEYSVGGKRCGMVTCRGVDGKVFVDGSADQVRDPDLARAAYAIYQEGSKKLIRCAVPRCFPASATIAEHMGYLDMVRHSEDSFIGVFDCMTVINNHGSDSAARAAGRKWAGIWREAQVGGPRPAATLKVKAHQKS